MDSVKSEIRDTQTRIHRTVVSGSKRYFGPGRHTEKTHVKCPQCEAEGKYPWTKYESWVKSGVILCRLPGHGQHDTCVCPNGHQFHDCKGEFVLETLPNDPKVLNAPLAAEQPDEGEGVVQDDAPEEEAPKRKPGRPRKRKG